MLGLVIMMGAVSRIRVVGVREENRFLLLFGVAQFFGS